MKLKRIAAILMLALLLVSGIAQAASAQWMNGLAMQVVNEVNMERSKRGLGALTIDPALTAAAETRALEIARKFSHTRPDGSKWSTVSKLAYGENIARGQKTADKVMAAWMTSDGHRRNILRESYGSIGVACVKVGNIYHWVQLFGK
ncbi:MAG: CAP domain-containing protein [Clostridia bacterium]|nr:CAP domain-containing protein [Clostridia bacterium]